MPPQQQRPQPPQKPGVTVSPMMQELLKSPRRQFQDNPENLRKHRELLQRPELKLAIDVALAEMTKGVISLGRNTDMVAPGVPQAADASFHIIHGAYEFAEIFYLLAEKIGAPAPQVDETRLEELN